VMESGTAAAIRNGPNEAATSPLPTATMLERAAGSPVRAMA
jgi:hypothetical protein